MNATAAPWDVDRRRYDAVIVGAGWSGSLIANHLGAKGWRVLVLEAGNPGGGTWDGHLDSLRTFHSAVAKVPNSPYRPNTAAPSPNVLDLAPVRPSGPDDPEYTATGYFVQNGPLPYGTDYLRAVGGTGMHWLGAVPRMHPDDFATKTTYGYGRDWPIGADTLQRYYAKAERAIGVAGDAEEQRELGVVTDPEYVYPMQRIPPTYLDDYLRERLDGQEIRDWQVMRDYRMRTLSIPQARNTRPTPGTPTGTDTVRRARWGCPTTGNAAWATPVAFPSAPSRRGRHPCASRPSSPPE